MLRLEVPVAPRVADVLRQLDITALGTRMVCVEVNQSPEAPFMEYLASHGFRKHHRNHENLIAVKP